jgi:hypothetical protein
MKIALSGSVGTPALDAFPTGAADPLQVDLFRAALNAPDAAGDDAEGMGNVTSPLAPIGRGVRRGLAGISHDWQQAQAIASDLEQRPVVDANTLRDAVTLARTSSRVSIGIDVVSKVAGKVSHTADVMSRG